ncbi:hypothetical protein Axi01nite_93190 [Actinoplanes xinjiangensis]|nr:hypothetical protein Axi01nite_93190 [Actinoplanes xinjiangensis]
MNGRHGPFGPSGRDVTPADGSHTRPRTTVTEWPLPPWENFYQDSAALRVTPAEWHLNPVPPAGTAREPDGVPDSM